MMEWFPFVFFGFKIIVLGTGMFFAVKWHQDRAKQEKEKKLKNQRAVSERQTQP